MTTTQEVKVGQVWKHKDSMYWLKVVALYGDGVEGAIFRSANIADEVGSTAKYSLDVLLCYYHLVSPAPTPAEFVPTYWKLKGSESRYRIDSEADANGHHLYSYLYQEGWDQVGKANFGGFLDFTQTDAHGTPLAEKQEQTHETKHVPDDASRVQPVTQPARLQEDVAEVVPVAPLPSIRMGQVWSRKDTDMLYRIDGRAKEGRFNFSCRKPDEREWSPLSITIIPKILHEKCNLISCDLADMVAAQERRYGNPPERERTDGRIE